MKQFFIYAIVAFLSIGATFAQEFVNEYGIKHPARDFKPYNYVCYQADSPLTIDGNLQEPSWQKAKWTEYFADIEGESKPQPRYKTRAKMLWDDNYLYVAAELYDPHIWGTLTKRDCVIFHDNDFEVFIDPNGDTHGYYEFEMNALNTVWDLLLVQPYRDRARVLDHFNFNGLKSAVNIYGSLNNPTDKDEKWTVEIAFPLDAFEYNRNNPIKDGAQWRINFSRVQWRSVIKDGKYQKEINPKTGKSYPEDNWVWSPQGEIAMHMPEMWGFLQFSKNKVGKGNVKFIYNKEEDVKWELRNIYYAQRDFKKKYNRFASNVKELKKVGLKLNALKFAPKIYLTPSQYEAVANDKQSSSYWHINQFGRTWKSSKK